MPNGRSTDSEDSPTQPELLLVESFLPNQARLEESHSKANVLESRSPPKDVFPQASSPPRLISLDRTWERTVEPKSVKYPSTSSNTVLLATPRVEHNLRVPSWASLFSDTDTTVDYAVGINKDDASRNAANELESITCPAPVESIRQYSNIERVKVVDSLQWNNETIAVHGSQSLKSATITEPCSVSDLRTSFKHPPSKGSESKVRVLPQIPVTTDNIKTAQPPSNESIQTCVPDVWPTSDLLIQFRYPLCKPHPSNLQSPAANASSTSLPKSGSSTAKPTLTDNYYLEYLDPVRMGCKFEGSGNDLEDMMRWETGKFADDGVLSGAFLDDGTDLGIIYELENSDPLTPRKQETVVSVEGINTPDSCKAPIVTEHDSSLEIACGHFRATKCAKCGREYTAADETISVTIHSKCATSMVDDKTLHDFGGKYPQEITINGTTYKAQTPEKAEKVANNSSSPLRTRASVRFDLPPDSSPCRASSVECVRGTPENSPIRGEASQASPTLSSLRRKLGAMILKSSSEQLHLEEAHTPEIEKVSPTRSENSSPDTHHSKSRGSLRRFLAGSLGKSSKKRIAVDLAMTNNWVALHRVDTEGPAPIGCKDINDDAV